MANLKNSVTLGYGANRLVKSWSKSYDEVRSMVKEGDSTDASHLVMTFDNYFKGSVILETTNEELLS